LLNAFGNALSQHLNYVQTAQSFCNFSSFYN